MEDTGKRLTIHIYKPLIQKHGQFLKFCIVGASNTVISLVVYYILIKFFGIYYLFSSVMAYCTGLLNGYFFSSTFVFHQKRNVKQGVKFIGVNISSLLINLLILYLLVEVSGISTLLAQLFATIINVFYNFTLNKWWTFK